VRKDLATRAAEREWTVGEVQKAVSEIGANRTKVGDLLAHLCRVVVEATAIEPQTLTPAERKHVRLARAMLGRLL
jgi:hypothetical protein